jgi:23S rRNA (guanosine2251-2'-O)-methyltransferase
MERMLGRDAVHQGMAISAAPLEDVFVQDIINAGAGKERSVVLMLDQVTDPHNVGAILRSASAFGADGVIMQRRHAPELEGVLCKTACGAVDHLPVAYETNLSRTLEELADAGYTIIGLDEHAPDSLSAIAVPAKSVLVLGAEGDGMRRLVREHCSVLVTLPTQKPINSLNVSNAAAVALYALISG